MFNNIGTRQRCQRRCIRDDTSPVRSHIRSILDLSSIQWQSAFSPITSCHLPFTPGRKRMRLTGPVSDEESRKYKKGREREKGEALRWIKAERGFKEVVTCVYVSPGLIFWMTCLHLRVITALLLNLCSPLFSSKFFRFATLEINQMHMFAFSAGSYFVFSIESDKFYTGVHLELSPETSLFSTGKAEEELAQKLTKVLLQALRYWHVFHKGYVCVFVCVLVNDTK